MRFCMLFDVTNDQVKNGMKRMDGELIGCMTTSVYDFATRLLCDLNADITEVALLSAICITSSGLLLFMYTITFYIFFLYL